MKSPFPGMDPYIEACGLWAGFHHHLIEDIYRAISAVLPPGYIADTGLRQYVVLMESEGKKENAAVADVTVNRLKPQEKPRKGRGKVAVVAAPHDTESISMQGYIVEEFKESFVEIFAHGDDNELVTCIEVLSPSNKKRGTEGWQQYERKRQGMFLGQANFLEIDLLRGGDKMPMLDPWPKSPYSLLVCRPLFAPHCRVWPASFQRRLPPIPVPLANSDPDLTLDLQPLIDGIYQLGRYAERLDYGKRLVPPLSESETIWVRETLNNRSLGSARKSGKTAR